MNQRKYWLGFNHIRGIGPARLRGLLAYFENDLAAAWQASRIVLQKAGLTPAAIDALQEFRQNNDLDILLESIENSGVMVCTLDDPMYPPLLKEIETAPPLLYIRGELLPEDSQSLAVIGTRKATSYGREVAQRIAKQMARAGVTIVSGLAHGIDSAAQRATIENGGRTIGVLGNGIDHIYPAESTDLARQILENGQGAIISEYPPGVPPDARHFPARNRIISGLTPGVLIVEAPKASGALLTADLAVEQGREVFAIPGQITAPTSQGTNLLIQQGARLVMSPEDILEELEVSYQNLQKAQQQSKPHSGPSTPIERELLRTIANEPLHIDDIAIQTGRSVHEISALMTLLELKGMVHAENGMVYRLASHIDHDLL